MTVPNRNQLNVLWEDSMSRSPVREVHHEDYMKKFQMENVEIRETRKDRVHEVRLKVKKAVPLLIDKHFTSHYLVLNDYKLFNGYVMTHRSKSNLFIDVMARCPMAEVKNINSYEFKTHPDFDRRIEEAVQSNAKRVAIMKQCRNWDVGLQLFMKVEFLETKQELESERNYTLKREYNILNCLWKNQSHSGVSLSDMVGIPMIFDYQVLSQSISKEPLSSSCTELNIYGEREPRHLDKDFKSPRLSYLTMEKLGPSLEYVQQLFAAENQRQQTLPFGAALKIFDQLNCRLLYLHQTGVVYRNMDPRHVHLGRRANCTTLYLSNFAHAAVLKNSVGDKGWRLYGDPNFASIMALEGKQPHPMHDYESLFYLLISFLVPKPPWAKLKEERDNENHVSFGNRLRVRTNDFVDHYNRRRIEHNINEKTSLWKQASAIQTIKAHMRVFGRDKHDPLGARSEMAGVHAIGELYTWMKLAKDNKFMTGSDPHAYSESLQHKTSEGFKFFMELRRRTLAFFIVKNIPFELDGPTIQKKRQNFGYENNDKWDLSMWFLPRIELNVKWHRGFQEAKSKQSRSKSEPHWMLQSASRSS